MISRVLVPMDDSEMSERALKYALEAHPDAEITVLTVVGEPSTMWGEAAAIALADDVERTAKKFAREILDRAEEIASENDAEITTDVRVGNPARSILDRAEEFDTVVVGSHGGTMAERLLVGNVAQKVVRRSPVPVTVVR
ncbi:Nucleotide-binding universal stress protein, UspA family [Halopelagius inordinatus]|uniref:Nucleotide-binding universal stress protein, UspA family n=1 Tax=Halopelagius inordinatus TaxID=553467 RepID=A0A1I2V3S8_9EURY|nr:universal stress protein [Halopelagius inordinatus]SFG83998.1 Nucleotide-binding universal stress protein, UspA family [Halopelagius inordinatus]